MGRTRGADQPDLTQHEAVADALGRLGVPVVLDVECGHVPPFLPLVDGALAHVVSRGDRHDLDSGPGPSPSVRGWAPWEWLTR